MDKTIGIKQLVTLIALALIPVFVLAEKKNIYLEHSNTLTFDQDRLPDCQILNGDVKFRHENAVMYCDSAYFYSKTNTLDAFSNVRMIQGDSIYVYGDFLFYNGDTKLARLRRNIRVENGSATLFTDSLNYDRLRNVCYYFDHGTIVDSTNVLKSVNGTFFPKSNDAIFQKKVSLTNKDMELLSDTLKYNTQSHIAKIVGPSNIYFDKSEIYSTSGWYDTDKDISELYKRSLLKDHDGHNITGDTIKYRKSLGEAEALSNVVMNDTVNNIILTGGYAYYNESVDSAYVIKKATLISFQPDDTDSIYSTADTLFYIKNDSITNLKGYYNVQSWGKDFQGIADSTFYSTADSIGRMFGTPVAWQGKNQSTGDSILIYTKNGEVNKIETIGSAFMFMKNDSIAYNQISGKKITCYVDSNKLDKIFVDGNARSIYFAEEESDTTTRAASDTVEYVGINVSESSEMTIYVDENNKMKQIILTPASKGVMYTPDKISNNEITRLKGLLDCYKIRPADRYDIYNPKDKNTLRQAAAAKPKHKRKKR